MTIGIAILTYKRPEAILATLESITKSDASTLQNSIIQVIDNDPNASAKNIVTDFSKTSNVKIFYTHEPNRGIANARNRAMKEVFETHHCDWLAFIDDDETVDPCWLSKLLSYQFKYQCDVVMGNVIFNLPPSCPHHVKNSSYFARIRPKSGSRIKTAFTGNVLISKRLHETGLRFDTCFNLSGGEDHHFFSQAYHKGFKMIYCGESISYSPVPDDRLNEKWLLKRAEISAMAATISDKIILGTSKALIKNIMHIGYRLGLGTIQIITLPFKQSLHWSHAMRHFVMAKGRTHGLFKSTADDLY